MTLSPINVALAIIYQQGKFLMQLRDDIPSILYPGHWALFGGHIEEGESPEIAMRRELKEEIAYEIITLEKFHSYQEANLVRHIYHLPLETSIHNLNLQEGQDLDLITIADIQAGQAYAKKLREFRPIGKPHQQVLLDFLTSEFQKITARN
ncbi:MAG: NUDIX domain-containing protein [Cyanobacteria bacterium J083]|nr:MAG: NUDIX domain-containing protein [Cyanobacteria bacterium J083]